VNEAPNEGVGFTYGGIARIDDFDAVDVETIAKTAGLHGPDLHFPDAAVVLFEFGAATGAGDVAGGKANGLRLGSKDPECNRPVGADIRRNDLRRLRTACLRFLSLADAGR
jgi:hypothetical protein